ncbi:coiled-coil and C2 domain-containing protein 2A [Scaptodrosophila lebanonensis]|uniref:Coiled-coil and C2 domain-containing protein 2A n=1 Tax=Drosophila lebanonensis TaxID=7225 RepID=A0A6J2UGU3_DROLE|nr:coiled-coil and C2 domain-containing protein 2A [Scaptodrosophila lebanonensis]
MQRQKCSASQNKTQRKKNRKTHTTRSFRKTDQEVHTLLQTQGRAEIFGTAEELEKRNLFFFHATEHAAAPLEHSLEASLAPGSESEDDSTAVITKNGTPLAATFIQIELGEPLVWPKLFCQRHYYDDSMLYSPSDTPNFQLPLLDMQLKRQQIRILNRFQEEAKRDASKLSASLMALLTELPTFVLDDAIYRSECDREFLSVFIDPSPAGQVTSLPTRRCLKLFFKQLRFTTHPQMLDEHRLAQQLEDLYDLYTQHLKNHVCEKVQQELQIARNVVAQLLRPDPGDDQIEAHITRQLRLTQQLRKRYYAESTLRRSMLQQLLTDWARLKELRKKQQFQCTRFQLSLSVLQPLDLDEACAAWKQQFEADLAEVYREHLQEYYCKRRLWSEEEKTSLKPPRKPQFNKIMIKLRAEYERAFKDPEEPQVNVVQVHSDDSAIYAANTPGSEALHKGRSFFMKLYFDNQFVAQTRSYRLEPDLHLYMNEGIGVLLERALPAQLHVWLYEKSSLSTHSQRIAEIIAPLDFGNSSESANRTDHVKFTFQSSPTSIFAGDLFLRFDCRLCEDRTLELDYIQRLPEVLRRKLLSIKLPTPSFQAESNITYRPPCGKQKRPNNERSQHMFAEQELQFCSIDSLLNNKRFQLLHSRHTQRNLHTKQLRLVPSLEHEIAEDLFLIPSVSRVLEPGFCWNPIDLHKHRGRKYIQLLYESIRSQSVQRAKILQTPQPLLLLNGEQPPGWASLWRAFGGWFMKQQVSRERSLDWRPQVDQVQHFQVVLHVVRATGVPVRSRHILNVESRRRSSSDPGGGGDMSASLFVTQTLMYSNVRPFITLSYGQRLCRSSSAEGSNPTWNEQLQLQLSGQICELRDDLKITLFDEMIEQQQPYGDEADIYQRVQCNWLGEYRIPMSSLLAIKKFEGCIELCMPKVLVGYKRPLIDSITNMAAEHYPELKESVHLWFYLSIEPCNYELPPVQTSALACAELPELQSYLLERQRWLELQQMKPERYVDPLVCTAHGKRVCLTRLLEPVPLPITTSTNVLDSVCRFVSLISQLRSYDACQSFQGVWLDNQVLLDSTWGSPKDLGVLLYNFMLTLDLPCWLVLGLACPVGECAFVLHRQLDSGELLLLAPGTGKRYSVKDVYCPLTRVYCVVGQQNIFYNIQEETRISMTNFDFNDAACWLPLFGKRKATPQGGVQKLDYVFKRSYELRELQKQIERKVMKKISAWRATRKTIWNRVFQPRLLSILREMEKLATHTSPHYDEPSYSEELEREYPNYRLYGFTLNFAYTNLAAISERIRSTCIHYNNNANIEFCVAVHINAYANDILSVWVFLLSVVPLIV